MLVVATLCLVLLMLTTVLHYEVLRWLSAALPVLSVRPRAKLVVVIIAAFAAHVAEIGLYALAIVALVRVGGVGTLGDPARFGFDVALYFSAETFTSLGYGDVVPSGDMRLLAGAEALNGLLLIGWSASYAYIAMERFWNGKSLGSD